MFAFQEHKTGGDVKVKVCCDDLQSDIYLESFLPLKAVYSNRSFVLGVAETCCTLKRLFDLVVYYLFSEPLEADRSSRGLLQKDSV